MSNIFQHIKNVNKALLYNFWPRGQLIVFYNTYCIKMYTLFVLTRSKEYNNFINDNDWKKVPPVKKSVNFKVWHEQMSTRWKIVAGERKKNPRLGKTNRISATLKI